jgi:hypothetical protein
MQWRDWSANRSIFLSPILGLANAMQCRLVCRSIDFVLLILGLPNAMQIGLPIDRFCIADSRLSKCNADWSADRSIFYCHF